jgi:excisionase family DNA binding protein
VENKIDVIGEKLDRLIELVGQLIAVERVGTPRLMSVEEVASYCAVSATTIRGLLERGQLTAVRLVSGAVRIERREVDSLVESSVGPVGRNGRGRAGGRAARERAREGRQA